MGRLFVVLFCAIFAFVSVPASAATLNLMPSSEWRLREYDDKCRMIRRFGEGEDQVSLWIDKAGPGRFVNITAIGRPFRSPYGARAKIAFSPGVPISRGFISSTSSKGRPVLVMFGVEPLAFVNEMATTEESAEEFVELDSVNGQGTIDPEFLRERHDAVTAIELSGALVQKVSLETGGIGEMMEQLQHCADRLAENRVRTPEGETRKGQGARDRDTFDWAPKIQANYPSFLLREMAQGSVGVRVQINPEGRATFCEVTNHTGPAGFNDAACLAMIRYSRFYPAIDAEGNPMWGSYSTRVTYRIN
ncbi:TonB family protein [Erythrobacter sp. THAF29]|uniref:TonB family protein n=1 Tax=Erythrobacter sp. THAF29 TaxID=2587851 RepID=UPI001267B7AF|nr:TonB family protein [Erythrobacter sp. THAF29]QFT76283.1 Gram-negative bacterial tonB protein [Erythrobacter sp. THAF29]